VTQVFDVPFAKFIFGGGGWDRDLKDSAIYVLGAQVISLGLFVKQQYII